MRKKTKFLFTSPIMAFVAPLIIILYFSLFQLSLASAADNSSPQTKNIQKKHKYIDPKTGLRTNYYKAALPKTVPGGTRINVNETFKIFKNKSAILIDVMAHTGTGPDPLDGIWRIAAPRNNIPGSIWLADVGTGTLTPEMKKYFKSNLKKITKGDKSKTILIYCTSDCWMAWNSVQRAAKWGYKNVLWFPEGTEEWEQAGHRLESATPIALEIKD